MFSVTLLLMAQAATASPAAPPVNELREVVVRGLNSFDESVNELNGFIVTRFAADSDAPKTGLALSSPEEVDAQNLHPLIVETVIIGSPADLADVRPGDRIVRLGRRRIEHESPEVFRNLTEDKPGPLELAVLRSGEELTLTIHRAPIACLQRSSARIDQKKWAQRIGELRKLSAMIRSGLDDERTPPVSRYTALHRQVGELFGLFRELGGLLSLELTEATTKECRFRTPAESPK